MDLDANRALYKFVAGLLDGLFVAGTTGEFPALDDAERLALFELALAEAGPDRVIAHIGAPDARHSARLARAAAALGGHADRGDHAVLPARAARRADGPLRPDPGGRADRELYAYIFPERTGLRVSPDVFARLASAARPGRGQGSAARPPAELAAYAAAAPGLRICSPATTRTRRPRCGRAARG